MLACLLPTVVCANVVLSEVQWMGTGLSTADEWLEFTYVPTGSGARSLQPLGGWYVTSVNSSHEEKTIFTFPDGSFIGSGQYAVVSNYDADHSWLAEEPDFTSTAISLPNTKLLLRLYNSGGVVMDTADDGVGVPFAGENASGTGAKRSMERAVLTGSGGIKEHWVSASTFIGLDDGAPLFGTPGYANGTGFSYDSTPPNDATNFSARLFSGTLLSTWTPSASLDVLLQEMHTNPPVGTGRIVLPATATGWSMFVSSGNTVELHLFSIDTSGHVSSGITLIVDTSEEYSPAEDPKQGSGSSAHPGVYITEVLANPIGKDDDEWIEIANLGTGSVHIAGWVLDDGNSPQAFTIPNVRMLSGAWPPRFASGFVLAAGEHVSFRKSVTALPLGNQGERISLLSGSSVIDSWEYPETAEDVSYGRKIDSPQVMQPFCMPTEGAPNTEDLLQPFIAI
ncbi:hypothetical protein COU78_04570, partial [Candidatus Peregrinibacteria bacterium CG10_big_fil_rev_8_21_14_0_10_49_24]